MHTFRCNCGHTIAVDPPSEHAGYVVWDSDVDASIDARQAAVQGFLAALTTGQRDAWMRYFYGTETKSRLAMKTDADVIEDILSKQDAYTRICYRCDACGRLYVQIQPRTDNFQGYRLEDD